MFRLGIVVVGLLALISASAFSDVRAADNAGFSVKGQVTNPLTLTVADLKMQSGIEIDAALQSQAGMTQGTYVGVSLYALVEQAGLIESTERDTRVKHVIEVTGRDGYTVSIALGEIDPDLEDKPVIIAYLRNGQPVEPAGSVRLIVPGDKHASRSVRDVATIEVK